VQVFDAEPEDWTSPSALEYDEGPLHAVARAYKRECHWDHAPGSPSPDYLWVCVYKPRWGVYDEDAQELDVSGSLVGFAIVADRDEDGEPEALAHLWVARQGRRAGYATLLLTEAERRFPALSTVEHPVTADGTAFLVARSPRLSAGLTRA
jgi:GNAT superfamily N-acetyltransferase